MGNVIPWSQIHPSITSQEPFVAVVIIDPQRQICVSEMISFDPEALASPDVSASEVIAAAQAAAAKVASGYRMRRKEAPTPTLPRKRGKEISAQDRENPFATLTLPLELGREDPKANKNPGGLRVLDGGKS
ncbi:MAG TPA: hypothetical protein VN913_02920 [Candidatus Binatus sp.]|jgi:hypothetical protein|nr:hypothetical protein [Candidatus Binatus sp.]